MNKNKKWYSLFLVMLISLATVIQPIQAVAAVATLNTVTEEAQTKSLDNIKETNQVVEEEPTTVSSEETQSTDTTDTIEETISSEKTEETTASEVQTSESSTEETKEVKRVKRSVDRESIDIKKLLQPGESFISNVVFNAIKDGQKIDYMENPVPSDALIQLIYDYTIPQRLLDEKTLKSGDYYDIKIPEQIKLKNFSGDLKGAEGVFGRYELINGAIRLTFNEKVEELNEISGSVNYAEKLKETIEAGENIIKIPLDGKEETVKLVVKPQNGKSISKSGETNPKEQTVRWDVSINTELNRLSNAKVTDVMPDGLIFKKVNVYPQTINLNGEVIGIGEALKPGVDYIASETGDTVSFIGAYAETNQSFKLVYETDIDQTKIREEGGKVSFINIATLSNKGQNDESADSSVELLYGRLIEKLAPKVNEDPEVKGHVYDWTVKYNYGYKKLPKNSSITDTVSKNLNYVEGSVNVETADGIKLTPGTDYVVTIKDNQMKINFLKDLDTAVDITYQTKVAFDVAGDTKDVNFTNNVKTDSGAESNNGGQIATDGLVKWGDVDYENRKINWSIQVNKYQYHMTNWKLSDTMSPGLTFNKDSFRVYNEQSRKDLVKDTHYSLKNTEKGFDVAFIGDLATKGTDSTYRIMYTTDFEPLKDNFSNTATANWKDKTGTDRHESVTRDEPIKLPYVKDVLKGGSYNAQTKKISWDITVNHNQETLKNATIVDPIMDNQDYVPKSARLFKMKVNKDGSLEYVEEMSDLIKESPDGKIVSVDLPEGSKSPYKLIFDTSLEGKLIDQNKYYNVASYTNNGIETKAEGSAEVTKGNVYGEKVGEVDKSNENFVKWSVNINPSQSKIKDVTVIDKPSTNQVLEESSVIVYGANVSSDGNISPDKNIILEKDKDYTVNIDTNNETGQQVFTVKFVNEISKAYVLEYRSMANTSLLEDDLTNKISVTGNNEKAVKTETSSSVKVVNSSGSATGTTASVKIVKIDKNSNEKTPLSGAKFELWTIKGKGQKDQLVRAGETDVKGELKFGNLRPNTDYLLFETKAPKGFTVSKQMRYGQKVKFSSDGETNLFKSHTVENDMPRINFGKVDSKDGHALANAKFMVKNDSGEFYNGIDNKYRATWVDSQDKVSDDVKKSLISDENGQVEVAGLSVGTYSIQEIVAPTGYDKLTQEVSFEVVDDLGWIRLKDPVTISNKEYEKTSISINKTWDDANNQDGKRPEEVKFDLFANETKVKELTLDSSSLVKIEGEDDLWRHTFGDLRKFDEDMKEIEYSLKEKPVSNYSPSKMTKADSNQFSITNSRTPEKVSVIVNKKWDDKNNQDNKRPFYVEVNLLAQVKGEDTAKHIKNIRVDQNSKWSYEFENLPKYRDGQEIIYTVTEEAVPGYEVEYVELDPFSLEKENAYGFDIINTHTPETIEISGTKTWDDANNQDGKRPESITVSLLADEEAVLDKDGKAVTKEVRADKAGNWSYTFSNLPKFKSGKEIVYSVKEAKVADYTSESKGMNLTNTHTPALINVSGTKTWNDKNNQDGKRPQSISITLFANGKEVKTQSFNGLPEAQKAEVNKESNWSYEFTDLPKYDAGTEIKYTVTEAAVDNYSMNQEGNNFTNSYTPGKTSVSVSKVWEDNGNRDSKRLNAVEMKLFKHTETNPTKVDTGESVTLSADNNWQDSFSDLDMYQSVGEKIIYTVAEVPVGNGYTSVVTGNAETGFIVTNTRSIEKISLKGKKTWDDGNNRDGARLDSITVYLLADGQPALDEKGDLIEPVVVTGVNTANTWSYEFKNVPKYQAKAMKKASTKETEKATPIVYTVEEEVTKKMTASKYKAAEIPDGSMNVTNKRKIDVVNLEGTKTWSDNNNRDNARPKSIKIHLLADGEPALDKAGNKVEPITVTGNNTVASWNYEFKEMPKNRAVKSGEELKSVEPIVYTVKEELTEEDKAAGYKAIERLMNVENQRDIETINLEGTKTWKDNNNRDNVRPKSIKIHLLADGEPALDEVGKAIEPITVTGNNTVNTWSYECNEYSSN